jgi:TetR/AcrR family transcriptional regulator, cholesterol catabolism regulator
METLVTKKVSIVLRLDSIMEIRNRILEKANELFMQFGIRSVSMDDIANGLGMSKKTLYQHFADKDELVMAVVDLHVLQMQGDCTACRMYAKDAIHEIFNTMDILLQEFSNMNPMVLYDLAKFHFKAYQKFKQHKDSYLLKVIRDNIEWGIRDELYRPDINVEIMSKFRLESMMLAFDINLYPPGKFNLASTSNMILEHFIYGVATIKGHKLIQKYNDQRKKQVVYEESKK